MTYKQFENSVFQIFNLLKNHNDDIGLDVKIPDPTNPGQLRQIDILINVDGVKTIVECRHHQVTQNVKWIEELIGRKLSLEADFLIGVSSSGFTEGARKKAKGFGIGLRDLKKITVQELKTWGKVCWFKVNYFQFKEMKMTILVDSRGKFIDYTANQINTFLIKNEIPFSFLNAHALELSKRIEYHKEYDLELDYYYYNPYELIGNEVFGIRFSFVCSKFLVEKKILETSLFGPPEKPKKNRNSSIQEFEDNSLIFVDTEKGGNFNVDISMFDPVPDSIIVGAIFGNLKNEKKYNLIITEKNLREIVIEKYIVGYNYELPSNK